MTTYRLKLERQSLKLKVNSRIPSALEVSNFLTITKTNGVYTFSVDYTLLGPGPISDPTTAYIALLDATLGTYKEVSLSSLLTSGLDADLQAIAALTGTGILARTASNTWVLRTVTGTANEITVTNGDGVAGVPTLSLPNALTFTGKTVTGGSYSGATITTSTYNGNIWTAGTGTLTLGAGKTATISNTLTFTGTDASSIAFGAGGTVAYTSNNLSAFAATTSAQLRTVLSDETGTGFAYFQGGDLGTPSAGVLTSATGLPISTGVSGLATGVATFLATPSSANLRAALTDEVGTGASYFVGGALGTPASGTLTNATGLPISTGLTGAGTGVLTALGVNVGTAGSPVVNGGVLGTPSSGTLTNATGLPLSGLVAQAAYTFVGNNTGSSAVPTAVDIATLTSKASPAAGDYIILSDQAASGAWKKATVSSVASAGSVSSIAGNTGAFTLANGLSNSTNVISQNLSGHNLAERNGGLEVWQVGTSIAVPASTVAYTADGFYLNTQATQASVVSRQTGLVSGSRYCAKVLRNSGQTGTGTMRFAMPLITDECIRAQGQLMAVSFTAKAGANWSPTSGTLTYNVYTGTAAAAKRGGSAYTGEANPITGSVNLTTSNSQTIAIASGAIGASATQIEIQFSWVPVGTAGADDSFYIDDLRLDIIPSGTSSWSPPVQHLDHGQYFFLCRQVYRQSYVEGTAPGTITSTGRIAYVAPSSGGESLPAYPYTPSMWTTPTSVTYSPDTGASGVVRNATGAADVASTLVTVTVDGHASGTLAHTAGNVYWYQYTSDARV